ncbi:hypothetical protein BDR06DRAFT_1031466 [Suillus hirtellus]|nr:hypothetical protein BDR06DRAFT_1031466 [Suillus hirtellus]
MADDEKFSSIADALQAGLENLGKWSWKTDEMNMYFICLALDPNYKLKYAQAQWDADAFDEESLKLHPLEEVADVVHWWRALQLLKSAYCNGHLQDATDATAHVEPDASIGATARFAILQGWVQVVL